MNGNTRNPSLIADPKEKYSKQALFEEGLLLFRLAPPAVDKDRPGSARQPADAEPLCHLGFGHEIDPVTRIQREDIQPAAMIGHDRALGVHRPASDAPADPQNDKGRAADELGDEGRDRAIGAEYRPLDQPHQQQQNKAAIGYKDQCRAPQHDQAPAQHSDPGLGRRGNSVPPHQPWRPVTSRLRV